MEFFVFFGRPSEPSVVTHLFPRRDNAESGYGLQNVGKMMQIMENCKNLGAIASQVRILQRSKNALTLMQSFDCSTTYVGVFGGSSLIGRSIACFGMAVMYRYRCVPKTVRWLHPARYAKKKLSNRCCEQGRLYLAAPVR